MSKILVVEDEEDVAKVLLTRLSVAGFQASVAADAYEAIKLAHEFNPDLVILDIMLPAGGGLFVFNNIKLSHPLNLVPVLVLTGIRDEEFKNSLMAQGVDAYMEKPYDHLELIKVIKDLLAKS